MDKIAIISDIHGNLEALTTVLADIERRGIQRIYCLGDIFLKGIHQKECVDLVKRYSEVTILGNCDDIFVDEARLAAMESLDRERILWSREHLTAGNKEYIKSLPFCYEFYLSGRLVRLLHAHPEDYSRVIGNVDKLERFYELFLPSDKTVSKQKADVVVYGHIHSAYALKIYNRLILNVGSAGDAFEYFHNPAKEADPRSTTMANYLILTGELGEREMKSGLSYEFVDLPYDVEKELADSNQYFEAKGCESELREGVYRTPKKLQKFFAAQGIDAEKI